NLPSVFPAPDLRKTESFFADIIAHFFSGDPFDNLTASAELILLLRQLANWTGEDPGIHTKAQRFIESGIGNNLTAQDIADACNVSVSWLYKLFRDTLNTTPGEYLQRCRLSAAKELLASTALPLSEIALRCGFNSQSYFSDCFRRAFGIPPREFRKNSVYPL
ncbi:MAG: helix-turn-helix transcriptional regulator, partial [Oscillospiraceae bacterium]|nr:helix-turn-helix transcriptional regulator [Oscillospiraceae bacterium]